MHERSRLILVEGLPGSGKSTTAEAITRILSECRRDLDVRFYEEGRTDHPCDYEGYAYLTEKEWAVLNKELPEWTGRLASNEIVRAAIPRGGWLLAYRSVRERTGEELPKLVRRCMEGKDVYELPLDLHRELIGRSWTSFAEHAVSEKDSKEIVYVFECCFIQNPVTMAMIRCGVDAETTIDYVKSLEHAVRGLHPFVVYVDQCNLGDSFRKAVAERPVEWSNGFMEYYLKQGYGAAAAFLPPHADSSESAREQALAATVEVLDAREAVEKRILERLELPVIVMDNSSYEESARTALLRKELNRIL